MKNSKAGHRFLLVLLVVSAVLVAFVIRPFIGALFAAAVFATVLRPIQVRVSSMLGDRPRVAASAIVTLLVLVAVLPLAYVGYLGTKQAITITSSAVKTVEERGVDGLIEDLPKGVQPFAQRLSGSLPNLSKLTGEGAGDEKPPAASKDESPKDEDEAPKNIAPSDAAGVVGGAAKIAKDVGTWLGGLALDIGILLVALFFLLVQGRELVAWVVEASPLPQRQTKDFVAELNEVTVAVFTSTVLTALIQTAVAAVGYLVAGTPGFLVVVLLTLICALIPAIGAATIVVVVGAITIATGDIGWGIGLIVWGLIPVALCDNILKPVLAQGRLRLPGSVLFFAMLGGLAMMGPMGVIAGPLIVSFFLVVLRALKGQRRFDDDPASEGDAARVDGAASADGATSGQDPTSSEPGNTTTFERARQLVADRPNVAKENGQ